MSITTPVTVTSLNALRERIFQINSRFREREKDREGEQLTEPKKRSENIV